MPRASQNYALTAPEMARLASRRSLENYAISMDSVSPLLDPFKPPLLEPSPLLMPQPGNYTVFPEIDLSGPNTVPRNSYEEDFSPLSAGSTTSTSWNNQRPCSTNVQTHNGNVAYFNSLSQRELNYFFSSDMLVDSLKSISTQTTPDVSPVILPMDGSKSMPIVNIPDIGLADRSMKVSPTGNTGDLGIIQVGMNQATGTMGPQRNVGGTGRRAVGRRGPLDPATRRKAAAMRGKSCSTCRKRKASVGRHFSPRSY